MSDNIPQELIDYIKQYIQTHPVLPTFANMRVHQGWASNSVVDYYIAKMERQGMVKRVEGEARYIWVGDSE